MKIDNERVEEFNNIIKDIISNETVQKMKNYRQHYDVSCYEHCYFTAYYCYKICKRFNLDYRSVARGAMVHDLFLYDWRVKNGRKGFHAFTHPKLACQNAEKLFVLTQKEKDIILTHMWPVTFTFPKSIEGLILTFVDKYSAINEGVMYYFKNLKRNESYKYAYLLLTFVILRIKLIVK